jgi:hypothetical protein
MTTQLPKHAKTSGQIIGVVLTGLISAYFSYRTSRAESDAQVSASKVKSEAGYEVLAKTVSDLQTGLMNEQRYSSRLEGRIEALERQGGRPAGALPPPPAFPPASRGGSGGLGAIGHGAGAGTGAGFGSAGGSLGSSGRPAAISVKPVTPSPLPRPEYKPKALPKNLDEAAQKRAAF